MGEHFPVNFTIGECRNGWKLLPRLPLIQNHHLQEAQIMAGYEYTEKQLKEWPEAPRSTYLWDALQHERNRKGYWEKRARSAERRMTEHDCQEGTE